MEVCVGEVVAYPHCVSCGQNYAGYVEQFFVTSGIFQEIIKYYFSNICENHWVTCKGY